MPLPLTCDQLVNTPKTRPHDDGQMAVIRDFRIVVDLDSPRVAGKNVLRHGHHLRQFGTNSELLGRSRELQRDSYNENYKRSGTSCGNCGFEGRNLAVNQRCPNCGVLFKGMQVKTR